MTKRVLQNTAAWSGDGVDHHALAIEGGVLVALDDDAVRWGRDHDAEFLDLQGRFVMPAFADGHAHPLFGGLESDGPHVRGHASVAGIVAAVRQYAAEHPELDWIGRRITVGEVELDVVGPCPRCVMVTRMVTDDLPQDRAILRHIVGDLDQNVGIYATIAKPGRIATGDAVVVPEV